MACADDYLEYFRRVPMFSTCSKKDLKTVAANAERVDVPAGRILCEQGQTGREAFVIVDGKARVLRNGRKVAIIGPGTTFGELSLLERAPRNATVLADSDMELLVLGQREFMKIVDASPAFARALLVGIARRLNEAEAKRPGLGGLVRGPGSGIEREPGRRGAEHVEDDAGRVAVGFGFEGVVFDHGLHDERAGQLELELRGACDFAARVERDPCAVHVAEREERVAAPALQRRLVLRVLGSVDARERRLGQRERLDPPLGQQMGFDDARLGLHHFDPATQARERGQRFFEQRHRFVVAAHPGQRATEAARRGSRAERVARRGPHAAGFGLRDLGCLEPSEVRVVLTDVVRHARRADDVARARECFTAALPDRQRVFPLALPRVVDSEVRQRVALPQRVVELLVDRQRTVAQVEALLRR